MGAQSPTSPEVKLESADRLLRRTSGRPDVQSLELGALLSEFAEWLTDDRQWHTGSAQNWSSLIEDVADRVVLLRDLSIAPIQQRLGSSVDELKRLRGVLVQAGVSRDEALRRQLRRVQDEVRATSKEPDLLVVGWRRVLEWEQTNPVRAVQGLAALRDLADLQGHNSKALFDRLARVLAGIARDIAALTGEAYTDESPRRRDETAEALLSFGEALLSMPAQPVGGVVWLEYLVADLHSPWMLELGPSVVLYQDDLLRRMLLHQPDDPRLPTDLRDGNHVLDASWFKADNEEALSVERNIPGDPRVYLRLELPEMPLGELLARARETAEFLVAFGALGGDNHGLWTVGDSYLVRGWGRSTSSATAVRDKHEPSPFRRDGTAFVLATHATELGRHLPLRSPELLVAGRLLVWLRQTGTSDPASRIVLCDRVVEQVCGWAGIAKPADFAAEFLKLSWINTQIRNRIVDSYRLLRFSPVSDQNLWQVIEPTEAPPPHSPPAYVGPTNLKAILDNIDELLKIAPTFLDATAGVQDLKRRTADRRAVGAWLDELGSDFKRRNGRLRRTRNALTHGGPITPETIDHVSHFAMTLAHHAIWPAVELLLLGDDLVDGFLDKQAGLRRSFARLREGAPISDALSWQP